MTTKARRHRSNHRSLAGPGVRPKPPGMQEVQAKGSASRLRVGADRLRSSSVTKVRSRQAWVQGLNQRREAQVRRYKFGSGFRGGSGSVQSSGSGSGLTPKGSGSGSSYNSEGLQDTVARCRFESGEETCKTQVSQPWWGATGENTYPLSNLPRALSG